MKTYFPLLSAFVFLFLALFDSDVVLAQTFTQAGWQGPTRQGLRGCQGTQCQGVKTNHDCGPSDVQITPTFVTGTVGKPVEIRFDATPICNDQTTTGQRGTIKWKTDAVQTIPDIWGIATYTYDQPTSQTIDIEIFCTCSERGGASDCRASGSVPVRVIK